MPVPPDWAQKLKEFVDEWRRKPGREEYLGDGPFDKFVLTEQAESFDSFLGWLNELQGSWCFRGQREAGWLLHTSLDRAVKREWSSGNSTGYDHLDRETEGRDLLFRFQQQAHLYLPHPPSSNDLSSWFALMQHHGVPTRFLDWTQSSYVAMYFALEEEPLEKERCSAVWAIDLDWLERKGEELLQPEAATSVSDDPKTRAEYVNSLLGQSEKPVIVKINSLKTNERMAAQQGIFLCKLFHRATFNQILMSMIIKPDPPDWPVVRKIEVGRNHRIKFLKTLRAMNIHRASLFPGLDGFGRSLKLDLEIKVKGAETLWTEVRE
jgi:FRG domain-containing protein